MSGFEASEDLLTLTYQLNPEAVFHNGEPITWEHWNALWNALNGLNPEYQIVSGEGYDLITSVEQGADEFEVIVTFCEPYPDYEALFSETAPLEAISDPETFNSGWVGDINNDWFTGPFEFGTYDAGAGSSSWCRATRGGDRAVARLAHRSCPRSRRAAHRRSPTTSSTRSTSVPIPTAMPCRSTRRARRSAPLPARTGVT